MFQFSLSALRAIAATAAVAGVLSAAPVFAGATDPDHGFLGSEPPVAPSAVAGGRNLRISGNIDLAWDGGADQTSYILLRYDAFTGAAVLFSVPGAATSYHDADTIANAMYCYVLAPLNGPTVLGLSDLLCTVVLGGGDFTLSLNQGTTASLTWSAPPGGADAYMFINIPLDGSPASYTPLSSSAVATTASAAPAGGCFQVMAFKGIHTALTDMLCGIPGITTLPAAARTAAAIPAADLEVLTEGRPLVAWAELGAH